MESNLTFNQSSRSGNDSNEMSRAKSTGSGRKDDDGDRVSNKDKIKNFFKKKVNK